MQNNKHWSIQHLSISTISWLLPSWCWPNFKVSFLWPSLTISHSLLTMENSTNLFMTLSQLVHDLFIHLSPISSWIVHKWFTTCSWLVNFLFTILYNYFYNIFTTCSWLVNNFFTFIFLNLFRTYSTIVNLSNSSSRLVKNLLITCSHLVRDLFTIC